MGRTGRHLGGGHGASAIPVFLLLTSRIPVTTDQRLTPPGESFSSYPRPVPRVRLCFTAAFAADHRLRPREVEEMDTTEIAAPC